MNFRNRLLAAMLGGAATLVLAGCAANSQTPVIPEKPSPTNAPEWHWIREPFLEAEEIVGLSELTLHGGQQSVFSHFAIRQEDGWRYLNAFTGNIFPDNPMSGRPYTMQGMIEDYFAYAGSVAQDDPIQTKQALESVEGLKVCDAGSRQPVVYPPTLLDGTLLAMEPQGIGFSCPPGYSFDSGIGINIVGLATVSDGWVEDGEGSGNWQMPALSDAWTGFILMNDQCTQIGQEVYEDYLDFHDGVAAMMKNGKWGYVDTEGREVTDFCYEPLTCANGFSDERSVPYSANEGWISVKKDGLCGVLDTQGREVIPCRFEDITSAYGGMVWAKENGKWGIVKLESFTGENR